jgi:beta-lactamase regulating signal transducer with metallopeptidase domain
MTTASDLMAWAQMSAERIVYSLIYSLIAGTLIFGFAALVLRVRRLNAGTRFAVWFCALAAMGAVFVFGGSWQSTASEAVAVSSRSAITLPGSWAIYLSVAWGATAWFGLMRIGWGLWKLRGLRKSCVTVDAAKLDPAVGKALAQGQRAGSIKLCVSDRVQSPTAVGLWKPAVVLPTWLVQDLSAAELEQVILHEVAHLRRWDDWTNLAQKFVKAVLFFHPAVWWVERRISLEREMACDDAVLAQTARPRAYAECLTHLAEKNFLRRSLALAQAAVSRVGQMTLRVAEILDASRPRATTRVWKPAVSLVAAFTFACLVMVVRSPKLVTFEDQRPAVANVAAVSLAAGSASDEPVGAVRTDAALRQPVSRTRIAPVIAKAEPAREQSKVQMQAVRTRPVQAQAGDLLWLANFYPAGFDSASGDSASGDSEQNVAPSIVPAKYSGVAQLAVTETFTVFVVGTPQGPQYVTYRMSVWRVRVLPAASRNTISPKTI